jgi:hypothetical protein
VSVMFHDIPPLYRLVESDKTVSFQRIERGMKQEFQLLKHHPVS